MRKILKKMLKKLLEKFLQGFLPKEQTYRELLLGWRLAVRE